MNVVVHGQDFRCMNRQDPVPRGPSMIGMGATFWKFVDLARNVVDAEFSRLSLPRIGENNANHRCSSSYSIMECDSFLQENSNDSPFSVHELLNKVRDSSQMQQYVQSHELFQSLQSLPLENLFISRQTVTY